MRHACRPESLHCLLIVARCSLQAACYSRALAEQGAVAIFNNDRMGELFMSTGEICTRIRQLRLLPFFHWFR